MVAIKALNYEWIRSKLALSGVEKLKFDHILTSTVVIKKVFFSVHKSQSIHLSLKL